MKVFTVGCLVVLGLMGMGCEKKEPAATGAGATEKAAQPAEKAAQPAAKAAEDVPCDKVVAKLAELNKDSGEPEKKLWTKACADMPAKAKACIVAATKVEETRDCMSGKIQ